VARGKAGTRPHLRFKSFRQCNLQSRWNRRPRAGLKRQIMGKCRDKIRARRIARGIGGQRQIDGTHDNSAAIFRLITAEQWYSQAVTPVTAQR